MGDGIEARVSALECEVKEIKVTCKDISDRLIRMEENLKNNKDKIVDLEKNTQAIMEMSTSVKMLTERVSDMITKLDKQDDRIDTLEKAPGKMALKSWVVIGSAVATGIVGFIIGIIKVKGGF